MKIDIKKLDIKKDHRGWVAEILRQEDLSEKEKKFGQIHISTAKPGQIKGKHYHKRKTEWFCVIAGNGILTLIDKKNGGKKQLVIGKNNMVTVKIPPNTWHAIENTGKSEMYLLAYISEPFNPKNPDTYFEEL